uniref:Uncharacterized protein n=1 Tax=Bacteriophage sp. TaxID=38018 RepID=A0A8D9PEI5_9VIRU|nr:MAG TPA: hypothetical protein [Bacteriophage sp.]
MPMYIKDKSNSFSECALKFFFSWKSLSSIRM